MELKGSARESRQEASDRLVLMARVRRELADLMSVEDSAVRQGPDKVISFAGTVRGDTETAFERIQERLAGLGYTARLSERPEGKHEVLAIKGLADSRPGKPWINVLLFLATVLSALYLGAVYDLSDSGLLNGVPDPEQNPWAALALPLGHLHRGIPFAATLLGILVTHEASHYVVGRRYGKPSLPYFIPMPLNPFGTMGAVIVNHGEGETDQYFGMLTGIGYSS